MVYVIIIGIVLMFIPLIHVFSIHKELRHMTRELGRIRSEGTNERLQITLGHQGTEDLAEQINGLMEDKQEVGRMALRSEKELTEMITSMSHDLRTPLTAIIGYVQLLEDSELTWEKRAKYTSIIHGRTSQLQALIKSFFALSAIQSGQETLEIERIDMKELVQDSMLSYYDMFEESGKKVEFDLPKEKCFFRGDRTACKRIIENIVLNALQHASENVEVIVETGNEGVSFCIQNTVHPGEVLDEKRLFDRLYTGDSTRKYHRGLGLPIVDRLMKQMNGTVEVEVQSGMFLIRCMWKK